jgi:hypothetical protein
MPPGHFAALIAPVHSPACCSCSCAFLCALIAFALLDQWLPPGRRVPSQQSPQPYHQYFDQMGPRQTEPDGTLEMAKCVRRYMPRYAAMGGRGIGPGQLGEAAKKAREGREALTPVEAKAEEAVPTILAAIRIEADDPQQPFPLTPTLRPPNLQALTPWAQSPGHIRICIA